MDAMTTDENSAAIKASPSIENPAHQRQEAPAEDANPKKRSRDDDDDNDDAPSPTRDDGAQADDSTQAGEPKLSKNQLRKQKRQKLWEDRREDRKRIRKEKRHDRVARRRQEREEQAAEVAAAMGIDMEKALRKVIADEARSRISRRSRPVPVALIVDCDFEKYMHENELVSLASQITRSFAMNRAGLFPAHLLISTWGGKLKERFETVLNSTHEKWKGVSFVEGDFVDAGRAAWNIMKGPNGGKACPALGGANEAEEHGSDGKTAEDDGKAEDQGQGQGQQASGDPGETMNDDKPDVPGFTTDSVIYLSADSPHTLDKLEPNTSYVIGGLVDRNREKNLCQRRAEQRGIRTAKLPIGEYLKMSSRRVLATNHVVEIMSKWLETGDWAKAFMAVIPKRKGGQLKSEDGAEQDGGDENNQDENDKEDDAEKVNSDAASKDADMKQDQSGLEATSGQDESKK